MAKIERLLKPRDPSFLEMRKRKAGAQVQSRKAVKARERSKLKKGVYE